MKKIVILALVCVLLSGMALTSCKKDADAKFVCGVTEYEPMNWRDSGGNWTGFDTDLAILVGEKLGMKVEFQEIEWSAKYQELEAGTINVIWNGFTANAYEADGTKRSDLVDFSYSYMLNQQSVIVRADRLSEFNTIEALEGKTGAAEAGSAGETFTRRAVGDSGRVIGTPAQISTFIEVKSGAVDFAVVDILLARRLAGSGDYFDLTVADIYLDYEVYAIGFKKGDALRTRVNQALKELYEDGTMMQLAQKYGVQDKLILDTNFSG